MLDVKFLIKNPEVVIEGLRKKNFLNAEETVYKIIDLHKQRNKVLQELETIRYQKKQIWK